MADFGEEQQLMADRPPPEEDLLAPRDAPLTLGAHTQVCCSMIHGLSFLEFQSKFGRAGEAVHTAHPMIRNGEADAGKLRGLMATGFCVSPPENRLSIIAKKITAWAG